MARDGSDERRLLLTIRVKAIRVVRFLLPNRKSYDALL
jgi:hypothetical protein